MSKEEALNIRAATVTELDSAMKNVRVLDAGALTKLEAQRQVDMDNAFAAWGTSLFTDMDTSDALDRYWRISTAVTNARPDLKWRFMAIPFRAGAARKCRHLPSGARRCAAEIQS